MYHLFEITGIDGLLSRIGNKSDMMRNGWNVDVDFSNGEDRKNKNVVKQRCALNTFYGYKEGEQVGRISTVLQGSGKIILKYGNCYDYLIGNVTVSLNGVQIDSTNLDYKWLSFQYKKGDFLEIKELDIAIIQIVQLIVLDGGNCFIYSL